MSCLHHKSINVDDDLIPDFLSLLKENIRKMLRDKVNH